MIEKLTFEKMRDNWGYRASWAVWADSDGIDPKSNLEWSKVNPTFPDPCFLKTLNPNAIMVGLNGSNHRNAKNPSQAPSLWGNFHSPYSCGNDAHIRFAFKNTPFWGAYMTDFIEYPNESDGKKVINAWGRGDICHKKNIDRFSAELSDLGTTNPLLIVFGKAHSILTEEETEKEIRDKVSIGKIVRINHFSSVGYEITDRIKEGISEKDATECEQKKYRAHCLECLKKYE
jgi:hypothetical protein